MEKAKVVGHVVLKKAQYIQKPLKVRLAPILAKAIREAKERRAN